MRDIIFNIAQKNGRQKIIYWENRDTSPEEISLPNLLERYLIDIRTEHMNWAYEIGFAEIHDKNLAEHLQCGQNLSMWWTSILYERHPKISPELYPVYKLRCLEKYMLSGQFDSLEVEGGDSKLKRSLKILCAARKWEFREKKSQKTVLNNNPEDSRDYKKSIYKFFPAPVRALVRFGWWLIAFRRKLPYVGNKWRNPSSSDSSQSQYLDATIATYFPNIDLQAASEGRFYSRYWEKLHTLLNEQARFERPSGPHFVRWVFIRFPSPGLTFDQCLKLRDAFQKNGMDGKSFNYLEEFLSTKGLFNATVRWGKLLLASLKIEKKFAGQCHFKDSCLNFWEYFKEDWAESFRGWRSLERCLQNESFINYYKLAGKQRWNLFPLENCPWERMLTHAAQADPASGPVYGSQHSIVRPTDFRYFDAPDTFENPECAQFQPQIVGLNGRNGYEQLKNNGLPLHRLRQLAALRYLYLNQFNEQDNTSSPHIDLPADGEPIYAASLKMLVVTSFFKGETQAHLNLLGQALDAGLLDKWEIIIKPHPYLNVADWVNARTMSRNISISYGAISTLLNQNIVVWASNSTTVALEAALKDLKLMVMRPINDFDLCPIQNVPGLMRTGSLDEVKKNLENLKPLKLPNNFLDIDDKLISWRKLLNLNYPVNLVLK